MDWQLPLPVIPQSTNATATGGHRVTRCLTLQTYNRYHPPKDFSAVLSFFLGVVAVIIIRESDDRHRSRPTQSAPEQSGFVSDRASAYWILTLAVAQDGIRDVRVLFFMVRKGHINLTNSPYLVVLSAYVTYGVLRYGTTLRPIIP